MTPLHLAAAGGHLEAARLLLDNRAPVSACSRTRTTPLHEAVERSHVDVVALLLERGADPTVKNTGYGTPLQAAQRGTPPSGPGDLAARAAIVRLLKQADEEFKKRQ